MNKISEKTLELNITHEILSLADSFWWYLQPISLKRYWRPHWRFPFMQTPKSFATGLHINLEGKKDGGFDVCIHSPSNFQGGNPRLLFMQFKAGVEKLFNENKESIFYGSEAKPNKHIEFDINSNKNRNQHRLLKELASKAGNKDAVVYVFPRIVNETKLQKNIGKLLTKTSFVSISDIDSKASIKDITIDDGNPHKFRTGYNDFHRNEINLLLLLLLLDNPGKFLGEIIAIRSFRALKSLQEVQLEDYTISKFHIIDALIRHVYNIGMYFSIPYNNILNSLSNYPGIYYRLKYMDDYKDLPIPYKVDENNTQFENLVFKDIMESLSTYFKWIEEIDYFKKEINIPEPPSEYTIELGNNGIFYDFNENSKYNLEDFDNIYYQLL